MTKRPLGIFLAVVTTLVFLQASAMAVPVTVSGYVADLTGIPHERPDITVRVRSARSGREIASGKADANGFFSIPIDPARVPDEDVRLSLSADGTATIGGRVTAVRTNGTLFGLAGEIDSKFSTRIPDSTDRVTQFIVLIVPKAQVKCVSYSTSRRCRLRFRR